MTTTEVAEEDLDYIDQVLLSVINDDSIFCVSQLDGFLTALVSGPEMIFPSEWFSVLWGGNENAPAWESGDEAMHFFGLLFTMMNNNAQILTGTPDDFEPMTLMDIECGKTIEVFYNWCNGYMRAVELREDLWADISEDIQEHLDAINLLGTDFDLPRLHSLSSEQLAELEQQIAPAARAIHAYWLQHRAHDMPITPSSDALISSMMPSMGMLSDRPRLADVLPFVREQAKIGRNDPCPCGSGKKYKKCCGLS
jgi:uncharacterized protein